MGTTCFFSLPYHGHVNPCIPVLAELVARGERVICYCTEEFCRPLEEAGAEVRLFPYEERERGIALLCMVTWQMHVSAQLLPELIHEARASGVAYVLTDYACLWGRYVAQHLKLPLVSLYSTFPAAFGSISPLKSLVDEIRARPALWPALITYRRLDRQLARCYGTRRLGLPMNLVLQPSGDLNVVLTSELLHPEGAVRCGGFHFVGTCVRPRGSTRGESLPGLDTRPLVYVSLGTIWNRRPDFYRTCIEAFADAPFQVVLSVGEGADARALGPTPAHIHVRGHVDQVEILRRADVFISHGGMNSVCEGLSAGVPLLLFPQANDQFPLAARVEALGAGVRLPAGEIRPHTLRRHTERLLADPMIRAGARKVGTILRKSCGPPAAADLILGMRERRRPAA